MQIDELFEDARKESWWTSSSEAFLSGLLENPGKWLLLFNADADGFSASYFLTKLFSSFRNEQSSLITRAVWNYEYDFAWLPKLCERETPDILICVDIPVIQESAIVKEIAVRYPVLIYDHHITREDIAIPRGVVYVNSRLLDPNRVNYPASYFAASLAYSRGLMNFADSVVLAVGLCGDRALERHKPVGEMALEQTEELRGGNNLIEITVQRFTSLINAQFRSNPNVTPQGAQQVLAELLSTTTTRKALQLYVERFQLGEAGNLVKEDVTAVLTELRREFPVSIPVLCKVVKMATYSVGIVASILSSERPRDVIALGYENGDRLQFEIRTHDDNALDLTKVLCLQKETFIPLTSGGHPKAAGALVRAEDGSQFCKSLSETVEVFRSTINDRRDNEMPAS